MKQTELLALMDKESWFTAQQAQEYKLIDEVMFESNQLVASFEMSGLLPQEVIDKMRNTLKNPSNAQFENKTDFSMQQKAKAKLKLLNLGGIK